MSKVKKTKDEVVDVNILYCDELLFSDDDCAKSYTSIIYLSDRLRIIDNALHVLAFGFCNNTIVEHLIVSGSDYISAEGVIAIIDCLKYNTTLTRLDLSQNGLSVNEMNKILKHIESQCAALLLEYIDLSKNDSSPWGVYCAIIRHCCFNSLTLCGDEGMKEYIKEITDSLQKNITLQSLTLLSIGAVGVESIKMVLVNNSTIKTLNLSWKKLHTKRILLHSIYLPNTNDDATQTTVNDTNRVVNVNILCDDGVSHGQLSCRANYELTCIINSSRKNAAHVLAFGLCDNTTVEQLDISNNDITDEEAITIIDCLKHNKTLTKLDLSQNRVSTYGMNYMSKHIENHGTALKYVDLSKNYSYPWGVYCAIIRHCCVNGLTLCGDKGMKECIKEVTDSLQANTTLQSLTLAKINIAEIQSVLLLLKNSLQMKSKYEVTHSLSVSVHGWFKDTFEFHMVINIRKCTL